MVERLREGLGPKGRPLALLVFAGFLVAALYGRVLAYQFVHDDVSLIEQSERLRDPATLGAALQHDLFWLSDGDTRPSPYWRPVTTASYYLDAFLSQWITGDVTAWVFHLSNLILLVLLAVASGRLVQSTQSQPPSWRTMAVFCAVLIVHPMQVEPAANITARPDLLVALFGCLAVARSGGAGAGWTLLALGAKETAIMIPLMGAIFGRGRNDRWRPHLLAVGFWLFVRGALLSGWNVAASDSGLPTVASLAGAAGHLWILIGRIAFPIDPIAAWTYPVLSLGVQVGAWLALLALIWVLYRWCIGPMGWLVLLPLLPVCGVMARSVRYGEGLMCWSLAGLAGVLGFTRKGRWLALIMLPWWTWVSWNRTPDWKDEQTLWASAVQVAPEDPLVALKYGRTRLEQDPGEALRSARVGLDTERDPRRRRELHALAANALVQLGRVSDAGTHLVVAAEPGDSERIWALSARCIYAARSEDPGAPALSDVCSAAAQLRPHDAGLLNAAGVEAAQRGAFAEAVAYFGRAVELEPEVPSFQRNLTNAQRDVKLNQP